MTVRSFIWDWILGRVVPVPLFAAVAFVQALVATEAQPMAGETLRGTLDFVHAALSLFFYALLTVAYVTRSARRAGRRGPLVVSVAVTATVAGALFVVLPRRPHPLLDTVGSLAIVVGLAYALWALVHLRRAFSILPEARSLVTTGPYALSRHPLYLGETLAMFGVVLPLADARLVLFVPFVLLQWVRLRWEEAVLRAELPEYGDYASRVPRYLPWLW